MDCKKLDNLPSSPFVTSFQFTTLGFTVLRSSRKNLPFDRFRSWNKEEI